MKIALEDTRPEYGIGKMSLRPWKTSQGKICTIVTAAVHRDGEYITTTVVMDAHELLQAAQLCYTQAQLAPHQPEEEVL